MLRGVLCIVWMLPFFLAARVSAVNFTQCLSDVQAGMYGPNPGAVDQFGNIVAFENLSTAVGVTYELCIHACGAGSVPFNWSYFSQSFSTWLLPWLALISQLPFGAKHRVDNLMSVLLAVGSPTLAGYSLALTILNNRYLAHRFSGISYPNVQQAFRIMRNLQQAPLEIDDTLLPSLVILPDNDEWWHELTDRLNYVHTWNISTLTSIAWVFIAYFFTVIDSFATIAGTSDVTGIGVSDGQAVGSLWLWLLAVVIGWQQISPKCDHTALKAAIGKANSLAFVACNVGGPRKASDIDDSRAISLVEEQDGDNDEGARDDERANPPIYNYARFLPWTLHADKVIAVFRNADSRARIHEPANGSVSGVWHMSEKDGEIHPLNRDGTYGDLEVYSGYPAHVPHWGEHVVSRFMLAGCVGLGLQWGTVCGSIIILIFTPTMGLGCRSASFILHASLSTIIWLMLVGSTLLVHSSASPDLGGSKSHMSKSSVRRLLLRQAAILLRRLAKMLATLNTTWIITSCLLQFSGAYATCFCNVQLVLVLSKQWDKTYNTIALPDVSSWIRAPWAGGVILGCGCVMLYLLFINLFINSKP